MESLRPKILFISSRADKSGGPTHLYGLMSDLSYRKQLKSLYCAAPISEFYSQNLQNLSKNFISLPPRQFSIKSFSALWQMIREEKIDLIHSHGRGAGLFSRLLKIVFKMAGHPIPIIHSFHGVHNETTFVGKIKLLIDQILAPLTDVFILTGPDEFQKAIKLRVANKNRSTIIPNGLDVKSLFLQTKNHDKNEQKKIFGIDNDNNNKNKKITAVIVTRFDAVKDNLSLINMIIKNKFYQDCNFLFIGGGDEWLSARELVKENQLENVIKLWGPLNDVTAALSIADLFISHSSMEGLPYSVLEAMALEVPCLLSDVDGHRSLIQHQKTGFLFLPNNPISFKLGIDFFLDAQRRQLIASEAKVEVESKYQINKMVDRLMEIYEAQ